MARCHSRQTPKRLPSIPGLTPGHALDVPDSSGRGDNRRSIDDGLLHLVTRKCRLTMVVPDACPVWYQQLQRPGRLARPQLAPDLGEVGDRVSAVAEPIRTGDYAGAAEQFIDTVALGPGMWLHLQHEIRQTLVRTRPAPLDECTDPDQLAFDVDAIRSFASPVLPTLADQSPPSLAPVVPFLGPRSRARTGSPSLEPGTSRTPLATSKQRVIRPQERQPSVPERTRWRWIDLRHRIAALAT